MTPDQKELARRALGLPNKQKWSYRRHFVVGPGSEHYESWMAMVAAGEATLSGDDLFHLTRAGAHAALEKGETLCPEDFPETELTL
ncbi:MAG: hypothetical protein K2Q12_07335 [Rickettsiales bacterium]|nr:hypothetical protein [Rickettsiales bacterium]